jgi:hypothetical protein
MNTTVLRIKNHGVTKNEICPHHPSNKLRHVWPSIALLRHRRQRWPSVVCVSREINIPTL